MKDRESNIELLRLICMFFIVFHHILVHGAYPELLQGGSAVASTNARISLFLNGLFYPAVNIFILISGYFGIKTNFRKFFNLYTICAFYGLIDYIICIIQTNQHIGRTILLRTFLPFLSSKLWFIPCYVALMCFAPLLERFIKSTDKKEYTITLLLLTIVNVYLGFLRKDGAINGDGYNVMQFLYMYVIGGYIRRFVDISQCRKLRWKNFAAYLCSAAIYTAFCLIQNHWGPHHYNSPLTILSAIAFFLFALSFSFKSKTVNYLASSAIAVYMIQSAPSFTSMFYPWINQISTNSCGIISFLIFTALATAVVISCCFVDRVRVLLMKPVWKVYEKIDVKKNGLH